MTIPFYGKINNNGTNVFGRFSGSSLGQQNFKYSRILQSSKVGPILIMFIQMAVAVFFVIAKAL
jgi:hypothetical protein